jgi:hypothetical protein
VVSTINFHETGFGGTTNENQASDKTKLKFRLVKVICQSNFFQNKKHYSAKNVNKLSPQYVTNSQK